jgi:hypothetical protein
MPDLKHVMVIGKETTGAITFTRGIALVLTACSLFVRTVLLSRATKLKPIKGEHSNPKNTPNAPGFFAKAEMGSIRFQRRKIFLAVIAFGGLRSSCSGIGSEEAAPPSAYRTVRKGPYTAPHARCIH